MQPGLRAARLGHLWVPAAPAMTLAVMLSRMAEPGSGQEMETSATTSSVTRQTHIWDKGAKGAGSTQAMCPAGCLPGSPSAPTPSSRDFRNGGPKATTKPAGGGPWWHIGGTW